MSTILAGQGQTHTIEAGMLLQVTTADGSSALVRSYPDYANEPTAVVATIGASATQSIGPYRSSQRVGIECNSGSCVASVVDQDAGVANPVASPNLTQVRQIQALVAGVRIADAVSRSITKDDNGAFLAPIVALTYTIPAGLNPMPSFTVDGPASGAISIARGGATTLNGAALTLNRTRASNPVGFVVLAHSETDSYGVSGV